MAIGAGLVSMWIAFALTDSVALAWVVFFVVGGVVFYSQKAPWQ